jgi:hypothetical protein
MIIGYDDTDAETTAVNVSTFYDMKRRPEIDLALASPAQSVTYRLHSFNPVVHSQLEGVIFKNTFTNGAGARRECFIAGSYTFVDRWETAYGSFFEEHTWVTRDVAVGPGRVRLLYAYHHRNGDGRNFKDQWTTELFGVQLPFTRRETSSYTQYQGYNIRGLGVTFDIRQCRLVISTYAWYDSPEAAKTAFDERYADKLYKNPWSYTSTTHKYNVDLTSTSRIHITGNSTPLSTLEAQLRGLLTPPDPLFKRFSISGEYWAYMAHRALQDVGLASNNGLAYVKDAASIATSFLSFGESLRSLASSMRRAGRSANAIRSAVKKSADAYLSIHYGWKLQFEDTRSYIDQFRNIGSGRGRVTTSSAQHTGIDQDWSITQYYHLLYDNLVEEKDMLSEFLAELDLLPTLENLWDLVPYSFIVDWFLDIGSMLNAIDNYYHITTKYRLICEITTIRATRIRNVYGLLPGCTGSLTETYYGRRISTNPYTPLPWSSESSGPFNHWFEGLALIVQRW